MEKEPFSTVDEEKVAYECPRITDYGTLAEHTAGIGGPKTDYLGNQDQGSGGPGS